jgi:hypothetical protein
MFFYQNNDLIDKCERDINYVIKILYEGTWAKSFLNSNTFLPENIKEVLNNYSVNPKEYLLTYFQFEDANFNLIDRIDVFPPEIFLRGDFLSIPDTKC